MPEREGPGHLPKAEIATGDSLSVGSLRGARFVTRVLDGSLQSNSHRWTRVLGYWASEEREAPV
ncbi:Hypothetical protein A7982_10037 [Minicystis rosea]|nr:Hypothetical protein A7982_10037 [Minicystis rosea]